MKVLVVLIALVFASAVLAENANGSEAETRHQVAAQPINYPQQQQLPQYNYYPPRQPTNYRPQGSGLFGGSNFLVTYMLYKIMLDILKPTTTASTTTTATPVTSTADTFTGGTTFNCKYSLYGTADGADAATKCAALGANFRIASTELQTAVNRVRIFDALGLASTTFYVGIQDSDGVTATEDPDWLVPAASVSSSDGITTLSHAPAAADVSSYCGRIIAGDYNGVQTENCQTGNALNYLCEYCG